MLTWVSADILLTSSQTDHYLTEHFYPGPVTYSVHVQEGMKSYTMVQCVLHNGIVKPSLINQSSDDREDSCGLNTSCEGSVLNVNLQLEHPSLPPTSVSSLLPAFYSNLRTNVNLVLTLCLTYLSNLCSLDTYIELYRVPYTRKGISRSHCASHYWVCRHSPMSHAE